MQDGVPQGPELGTTGLNNKKLKMVQYEHKEYVLEEIDVEKII